MFRVVLRGVRALLAPPQ